MLLHKDYIRDELMKYNIYELEIVGHKKWHEYKNKYTKVISKEHEWFSYVCKRRRISFDAEFLIKDEKNGYLIEATIYAWDNTWVEGNKPSIRLGDLNEEVYIGFIEKTDTKEFEKMQMLSRVEKDNIVGSLDEHSLFYVAEELLDKDKIMALLSL